MTPPFELISLQGNSIDWEQDMDKCHTPEYSVSCANSKMSFTPVPLFNSTLWYNKYKADRRSGFYARADVPLLELSIQITGKTSYVLQPTGHYITEPAHFNLTYLPYMESKTWLDAGMQATTLDIHFTADYLRQEFTGKYRFLDTFLKNVENKTPAYLFIEPHRATTCMMALIFDILALLQQKIINRLLLEINVFCLLHYALICRADMDNKGTIISLEYAKRIGLIQSFLNASFLQKLTIPQLAKQAHMGQVQFKTLFREITGIPPLMYRNQCRMSKASLDLVYTQESIKNIAYELGFTSPASFSAAFSEKYGHSPRAYRKLYS